MRPFTEADALEQPAMVNIVEAQKKAHVHKLTGLYIYRRREARVSLIPPNSLIQPHPDAPHRLSFPRPTPRLSSFPRNHVVTLQCHHRRPPPIPHSSMALPLPHSSLSPLIGVPYPLHRSRPIAPPPSTTAAGSMAAATKRRPGGGGLSDP